MKSIFKTIYIALVVLMLPIVLAAQSEAQIVVSYLGANGQVAEGLRCGTPSPSHAQRDKMQADLNRFLSQKGFQAQALQGPVTVPVAFHVVTHSDGTTGDVSNAQIDDQLAVLNSAYNGTSFGFSKRSVD